MNRIDKSLRASWLGLNIHRTTCLLALLCLCGCTPGWGWSADTRTIRCDKGKRLAVFAYSVEAQGIQFPGSPVMLQSDIPNKVRKLWVADDRFLAIEDAGPQLHCDNFDANRQLIGGRCEGHRKVPGYHVFKYSHDRFDHWLLRSNEWRAAQSIDYTPSAQPLSTMTGCAPVFSYLLMTYISIKWHLWDVARQ